MLLKRVLGVGRKPETQIPNRKAAKTLNLKLRSLYPESDLAARTLNPLNPNPKPQPLGSKESRPFGNLLVEVCQQQLQLPAANNPKP